MTPSQPEVKRIVTRPDFDGVVCAVLLRAAVGKLPILWVQPGQIQDGEVAVEAGDVLANLPYHPAASLWFDHHYSNQIQGPFRGAFRLAPSAARVVYEYYPSVADGRFDELVGAADKIDAARLSLDEIRHPERYPAILLSMTLRGSDPDQQPFWDRLVDLLADGSIARAMKDAQVQALCRQVVEDNRAYARLLAAHTTCKGMVSFTDFRDMDPVPEGNRFLVYSLFPDTVVNVKVYRQQGVTVVKVGHSIVNRRCRVNVGALMAAFGGGGHRGAGACRFPSEQEKENLDRILAVLEANDVFPPGDRPERSAP